VCSGQTQLPAFEEQQITKQLQDSPRATSLGPPKAISAHRGGSFCPLGMRDPCQLLDQAGGGWRCGEGCNTEAVCHSQGREPKTKAWKEQGHKGSRTFPANDWKANPKQRVESPYHQRRLNRVVTLLRQKHGGEGGYSY